MPELTSFVALPKPQSYAPVNLLEQNVFTNWRRAYISGSNGSKCQFLEQDIAETAATLAC